MALLGLNEAQYAERVEHFGYAFATYYTINNEWSVKYLTRSAGYWAWWKKQFDLRDELFLAEYGAYKGQGIEADLIQLWTGTHTPVKVEAYPAPHIIADAWQNMLQAVNEEKQDLLTV